MKEQVYIIKNMEGGKPWTADAAFAVVRMIHSHSKVDTSVKVACTI